MAGLREEGGIPGDETLERVFSRLKPYCVDLLELVRNPKKNASFLPEMIDFLHHVPPDALQPCLDYTLFPLLLLLDAAVECRKEQNADSYGSLGNGGAPLRGLEISDSVAEGVLTCLEELLKKCHLGSVNQMVVVLKKLTSGALLSPSEASEEFREGIIKCFRSMLLRLLPCSNSSCLCKQMVYLPTIISFSTLQTEHATSVSYFLEPEECLLAFLRSQNASAAVGHWLSLLLQTAELEASRGHHGSASLRKEAFFTLRVLVAKVGTADALAFFLPGIVSRFAKALYISKSMISGAAGSTASIEHAVCGLTEFLMIVLNDEANLCGLEMSINDISGFCLKESRSTQSVLEVLRHLPVSSQNQSKNIAGESSNQSITVVSSKDELKEKSDHYGHGSRSLYVHRTKEWIDETSANVDKLLSATFPHLSVHPAEKVRKALVDGIAGLLSNCSYTLRKSKLMLLECLCVLVCDDSVVVSVAAQESLESLFMVGEKFLTENEISEIFTSLTERLPRVILGSEETVALSHAQRLLALMYYAGPELVTNHLLCSPIKASRFLDCLSLSLSHNLQFAGSVDKIISSKPLSVGYLLSVAELKAGILMSGSSHSIDHPSTSSNSKISLVQDNDFQNMAENVNCSYEFPHMPPWFLHIGNHRLYVALAGILRLVGLSMTAGHRSDVSLSVLMDILLDYFHKLISDLRIRAYNKESWQSWHSRSGSRKLLRQTSIAGCMLNEMIYGLSDQSVSLNSKLFMKKGAEIEEAQGVEFTCNNDQPSGFRNDGSAWKVRQEKDTRDHVMHCVGSILHEYMSPEVWDLPIDQKSPLLEHEIETDVSLHFFRDATMLHQVIIDGIGVFSIVLGKDFVCSGFMHSSIYLLLQNLICSNNQIRNASDAVLRALAASCSYPTVGHLVVANADYIVDSLCRQLRHLDLNPHVPDVIAAMLSYIGAAHDILPLLEEPMRAVSSELEVLGRHQHPNLTIPFLKAVAEITKASRREACKLPGEAESFRSHVNPEVLVLQKMIKEERIENREPHDGSVASDKVNVCLGVEYWEELLYKLNEMKRYRRTVGSLVGSCLKAATPLLSSQKELACLVALDIVEDVTISLAKVEEAYKHEKQTKATIEEAMQLLLLNDLQDTIDAADEEVDENRLLPAMNKIWPYFILCLKNKISVAVIRRCTNVMSEAVEIAGGDFFVRRFHSDGPIIWKLLMSSPFRRKPMQAKDETPLLLPYRCSSGSSEEPMAEISNQKIQAAVLDMIAKISLNKRSASALGTVLKKVSGLVVGVAYSSVTGLRDASIKALSGLAHIDSDLIWLLLADVYYSVNKKNVPSPPTSDLTGMSQLLPPPLSSKEYLYLQYGGESFGFDVDPSSVEMVFKKMLSEVFT
ncbi:uncharacterized protein [Elaeis guineensis]|uniref:Uncharacterized protein LOC105053825 isoform X2 n=1 Tax=Elaeis guineensis var. tenera TaxID=51953 RepID=A0A6I9S4S7_ELAGV|nr:uncharacterized protein LOC105053825 isoform X2 [Elaeis guineensis]